MTSELPDIAPLPPDADLAALREKVNELVRQLNRLRPISTDYVRVISTDAGVAYERLTAD